MSIQRGQIFFKGRGNLALVFSAGRGSLAPAFDFQIRDCIASSVSEHTYAASPELKATLRTKAGILNLHRQVWHVSGEELARLVLSLFEPSEHAEI